MMAPDRRELVLHTVLLLLYLNLHIECLSHNARGLFLNEKYILRPKSTWYLLHVLLK